MAHPLHMTRHNQPEWENGMTNKPNTNTRLTALVLLSSFALAPLATAQISDFERPFGFGFGEENRPFDPSTRDINGNRLIVDGRIITGLSLIHI